MGSAAEIVILMADDDEEDRMLVADAIQETGAKADLHFVGDGEELLDYLHRRGRFAAPEAAPRPSLILLDLNMPRKDGREALQEIKRDPQLRRIPIVVLSTSKANDDVMRSYSLGASSFISKPGSFDGLVRVMEALRHYWLEVVHLPQQLA